MAIVKMVVNMIVMDVFGIVWENLDQERKRQLKLKRCNMKKVEAKTIKLINIGVILDEFLCKIG